MARRVIVHNHFPARRAKDASISTQSLRLERGVTGAERRATLKELEKLGELVDD